MLLGNVTPANRLKLSLLQALSVVAAAAALAPIRTLFDRQMEET